MDPSVVARRDVYGLYLVIPLDMQRRTLPGEVAMVYEQAIHLKRPPLGRSWAYTPIYGETPTTEAARANIDGIRPLTAKDWVFVKQMLGIAP